MTNKSIGDQSSAARFRGTDRKVKIPEKLQYCIGQGQYPGEYWTLATALGDDILADKYDAYTDEQLMEVLVTFQTTAGTYIAQ